MSFNRDYLGFHVGPSTATIWMTTLFGTVSIGGKQASGKGGFPATANSAHDDHEEADEESSKKAKFFFSTTVQNWDAEFYVKVDKDIHLDLALTSSFSFESGLQEVTKNKGEKGSGTEARDGGGMAVKAEFEHCPNVSDF
ncbi:hypothetical protein L1987_01515 [Smallanthus sonchifolius]|uniref:Uncharacterized protein n=1 Tax=Smallanthus sonchifolius TaxID=185202 RepID=A0ACB9K5F6_9ASTR|nr:hypothetical protein L1987_01515 [Smallanthus sonchifolius]